MHSLSEDGNIVAETAMRIFADLGDPQAVNRARHGDWKAPLWHALAGAGLTLAWVPERLGGAGASLADGFAVLGVAGRNAVAVPLAETMLAGCLLAQAELASPSGMMTVAPARPHDRIVVNADHSLSGSAASVPFAGEAQYIAVSALDGNDTVIALVEAAQCRRDNDGHLSGEAASVTFDRIVPLQCAVAPAGFDQGTLMAMGAAVRSVETAGALEAILAMSVRYANERVAFGKPIGKFQAVQQNLARLAGETAAALAASGSAADATARSPRLDGDDVFLEVAAAKIRTAEAAAEGAAIAHQVHGAIGFTLEHVLHRFTLRMLAWRDDFGNESHWAAELGQLMARYGSDRFWPMLASR